MVESVDVVGFGEDLNLPHSQIAALALQVGREYKNSLAEKSAEGLEKSLGDPGHKISVIPRANLVSKGRMHVEFDVIVAPEDQLFINGDLAVSE